MRSGARIDHAACAALALLLPLLAACPGPGGKGAVGKPTDPAGDKEQMAKGEQGERASARPGGKGRAVTQIKLPKGAMVGDAVQLEGFFEDEMSSEGDSGSGEGKGKPESSGMVERAAGQVAGGAVKDIYRRVAPATVIVQSKRGYGTGVIYHPEGWVLTNHHVIAHPWRDSFRWKVKIAIGALSKEGVMERRDKVYWAYVHKTDPLLDLAVLKIIDPPKDLPAIAMSPQDPTPGDAVTALGHAGIGLVWAIKDGQISAVGKLSTHLAHLMLYSGKAPVAGTGGKMSSQERRQREQLERYRKQLEKEKPALVIQSTCDISQGDSGGPLVNRQAELVGLNAFVRSGGSARKESNFHIHAREIRRFIEKVPAVPPELLPDPWRDGGSMAKLGDGDLDSQVDVMIALRLVTRRVFFRAYRRLTPTAFFFDLDQDSFKPGTDLPEPKELLKKRSFDAELIFLVGSDNLLYAWYDRNNDGKLDILLVAEQGLQKKVIEAYRLDDTGKPKPAAELLKGPLVRPELFEDVKLAVRLRKAGARFFNQRLLPGPRGASAERPDPINAIGHAGKLRDYNRDGKPDTIFASGLFSSGYLVDVDQDSLGDFSLKDSLRKVRKNRAIDAEFSLITQRSEKWAWYDRNNDGKFDLLLHAGSSPYTFVDQAWEVQDGKYTEDKTMIGRLLIQPYLVQGLGDKLATITQRLVYRASAKGTGAAVFPDPNDYLGYRKQMLDAGRWRNVALSGRYGSCNALLVDLDRDTERKAKKAKQTLDAWVKAGKFDAELAQVNCSGRVWTFYDTRNRGFYDVVVYGQGVSRGKAQTKPLAVYLIDKKGAITLRKKGLSCRGSVHPRLFRNGTLLRNLRKVSKKVLVDQPDFACRP